MNQNSKQAKSTEAARAAAFDKAYAEVTGGRKDIYLSEFGLNEVRRLAALYAAAAQ